MAGFLINNSQDMSFKLDTKEKFREITPFEPVFTAILAEHLCNQMPNWMAEAPYNVILNLENIHTLESAAAERFTYWQQEFYENNRSFVFCNIQPAVQTQLENFDLIDELNITPTLSEAWDIVQIEEIERELMSDFDDGPLEEDE